MANALYPKFKGQLGLGTIDLSDPYLVVRAIAVDTADYVYDAAHEFLSDVPAAARVALTEALENVDWDPDTARFDSDDPTFSAVSGDTIEALILFIDTGVEATSRLIMFQDTDITGAPATPTGGDIAVFVDANGWFTL